tara:strand:+ start:8073 stop:8507 length:435 start_codon:yes stop_codon:yes gene_type:complete
MAQISIIADDKMVVKDGAGISGLTLSSVPADVWAVQWDSTTSKGIVEKRDWSVTEITELGIYQACVDEYETAKSKIPTSSTRSAEDRFREARYLRLVNSDWTQSSDSPLSDDKKKEWATYRQALRDLPQNESDFSKIELPEEPS